MTVPYYPGITITPNLGMSLVGMDEVVADNFILIDKFAGGVSGSIEVNGSVVNNPNFVDSATATFHVSGSNVSITTSGGFSNPMTTLGDLIYENATPAAARLAGNTTTTKMYLSQTGTGLISAAPAWAQIAYADISGTPSSLPPSGAASGDLSGTYPSPTVVQINGAAIPVSKAIVGTNGSGQIIDATSTTLPTAMFPALTGDVTNTAGSLATSVVKVNGAAIPTSKTIVGTNGSGQFVDASSATLSNNTTGTAANLSGTPALPNGTTATTQSSGDASTKLATDQFVATAVGALVAPQLVQTNLLAQYNMTDAGGATGFILTDSSANANHGSLGISATITNISKSGTTLTVTCANSFTAANQVTFYGVSVNTVLNGNTYTIATASGTQFTITGFGSAVTNGADTGTAVSQFPTFLAGTGGLSFSAATKQFASLPAAINNAKTMMLVTFFDPNASGVTEYGSPLSPNSGSVGPTIMYTYAQRTNSPIGSQYYCAQGYNSAGSFVARGNGPIAGYIVLTLSQQVGGDQFYYYSTGMGQSTTLGTNAATNYQLGGGHGASPATWFQGQILFAAFWSTALTTAQITQNVQAVQNMFIQRGIPLTNKPVDSFWQTPDYVDTFVLDGDSETTYLNAASQFSTITGSPNIFSNGQSGQTAETINYTSTFSTDPFLPNMGSTVNGGTQGAGANRAGVIVFIGTNDSGGSATIPLGSLALYCRNRHKAGWNKVYCVTMMSRTGVDTFKNSYDGLIRQYWENWADGLLDVAACPVFGADGANGNTSYFSSGLHWSTSLSQMMSGRMYSWALRRMYGNSLNGSPNVAVASPYLVQPEDVFFCTNTAGAISAYLISAQFFTGQSITVKNQGAGTLTLNPKPVSATITNLALTTNVITITASNNYTAGDVVILSGLTTNPTLNGTPLTINSTGLSSSSFQANLTHANITSAAETGTAYDANYCQIGANTNVVETAGNLVTLTVSNNFANGSTILLSGLTTATWLNGQSVTLSSATSTQIQFTDPTAHGAQASAAETGICLFAYAADTIDGASSLSVLGGASVTLTSKLIGSSTGGASWIVT